jgi:hypothetical protein
LRKLACTILIIIVLVGALVFFGVGHAATYVNAPITSNTTLTVENSPYTLTESLIINYGATLTIDAGVTVDFGPYQMQVNGGLNARGSDGSKIWFTSSYSSPQIEFTPSSTAWNEETGSGCIIDNAIISSIPIVINDASPKISNTYFTLNSAPTTPITISGGSPFVVNSVINFPTSADGIHVNSGSPTIHSNLIRGQGQSSLYGIYTAGSAYIASNNITNCYSGIWVTGQSAIVQNNIMNNAHDGVRTDYFGATIQDNVIANNLCGVSGTGIIVGNTITGNSQAGIWGPLPTGGITKNNIYGNPQNVHLTELANITAPNNWWGTADAAAINQTIWDYKNDPINLGTLTFVPFLTAPNPSAPSVPATIPIPTQPPAPSPSSTPTPTETPTDEPTPTPTPYYTDNPTPTPTQTPITPVESPNAILGQINTADLVNVIVILSAITAAIVIIILINRRFAKKQ